MAITAAMVKDLRERTGAGMMDCKKALVEVDGDMEKAVDYLREKGMAKAAKKAGRATSEGLVVFAQNADASRVAMASLQCETDFVSRGDDFKNFAAKVAQAVLDNMPADDAALQALVGEDLKALIAKTGENMRLGKFYVYERAANEVIGQYLHTASGKLGVMTILEVGKPETAANEQVVSLAREVAMQAAALRPMALDRDSLDPAVIERERSVCPQRRQARTHHRKDCRRRCGQVLQGCLPHGSGLHPRRQEERGSVREGNCQGSGRQHHREVLHPHRTGCRGSSPGSRIGHKRYLSP